MRSLFSVFTLFLCLTALAPAQTAEQSPSTDIQLRGISAVTSNVGWASGSGGTILRTVDGGTTWKRLHIAGTEKLDFRDIHAFDDLTAFVLSTGLGEESRIYRTHDGGQHWDLQFTNHDPKAFYDCFAFWDRDHGMAVSDSVDGKFPLVATTDGLAWKPLTPKKMPGALPSEGSFAASGTCIATSGEKDVWFVTGGPAARVFHSSNRGKSWTATTTPIVNGEPSQGIFSIAFCDRKHGVIVGGDYKQPANSEKIAAYSEDGGKTWTLSDKFPAGFRSAVAAVRGGGAADSCQKFIAVGSTGTDTSGDHGKSWTKQNDADYNAVSLAGSSGWAVGPHERITRMELSPGH